MHYFIYATKDAWISSGSSHIDGTSYRDQNFGQDEILEIKKEFWNQSFDYQTRALISFAGTEFINVSQSIVAGDITNPKFYLRLYEAAGTQELSTEYKLAAFPLSQSWDEGIGKFGDNPKATNGVSWNNRNYYPGSSEVTWSSTAAVGDTFASGTLTISTGNYTNQEITIGSVDFIFVSGSTSVFDNNSSEIFVESGSSVDISANNLTGSINDNVATHGLSISASKGGTGIVILSGSSAGTVANLTAASSSALFTFNGDKSQALEGGTDSTSAVGGNGPSVVIGSTDASQSFSYESPDIEMDVTNIVDNWLNGTNKNYGLQLRFSGSQETNSTTFGQLKFFSSQTHTVYPPKLEVRWDDHVACSGSNTGSLTQLTMSGVEDNYLYMKRFREKYRESEKVKFRIGARKRYIQKTFSTSVQTITGSYISENSGSYSIVDVATGESVIPFSDYTKLSCDSTSNYFIQWLNGFAPDRVYKILLKLKTDDSQEQIFDDGFEFIITR